MHIYACNEVLSLLNRVTQILCMTEAKEVQMVCWSFSLKLISTQEMKKIFLNFYHSMSKFRRYIDVIFLIFPRK